jgi:hypothetical protein
MGFLRRGVKGVSFYYQLIIEINGADDERDR